MSVHDAEPSDVYVDAAGKLWRVIGICGEPTVIVEEIEPACKESPVRQRGGVSGYMWHGWKRIHRPLKINTSDIAERKWTLDDIGHNSRGK